MYIVFFFLFLFRSDSMHQRDECEHPPVGRHSVRADRQHQLGGGLQVFDGHAQPDGLWQRGRASARILKGFLHCQYACHCWPATLPPLDACLWLVSFFFSRCASEGSWKNKLCIAPLAPTKGLCVFFPQRFIQYLASRNTLFNLSNFLDKSGLQGTWPIKCL